MSALAGAPPSLPFTGTSRPYYVCRPEGAGGPSPARIPVEFAEGEAYPGGLRVFHDGEEVPSGLLDLSVYPDGSVQAATIVFLSDLAAGEEGVYWVSRSDDTGVSEPDYGLVPAGNGLLDNGLISIAFDLDGWPISLQRESLEFAAGRLLGPGITFQGGLSGPGQLDPVDASATVRERGVLAQHTGRGSYQVFCSGQPLDGSVLLQFRVYAGLPVVEVQVEADYPALDGSCLEGFTEAYPLGLSPALSSYRLKVWKHNYFDYTSSYEITQPADSLNSHVTASWMAVSDESMGLMVAYQAEELAGLAFCPIKVRYDAFGELEPVLNPFGTLWGEFPDHDAARTGGIGLGETLTLMLGEQFQPSAPAYAGTESRFSVALLPYAGDRPTEVDQALAEAYSYPPHYIALPEP
jgi:hypothetical protein